jgi:hypothetical protein
MSTWQVEPSADVLRPRAARQVVLPWRERHFLYEAYERLLRALADEDRYRVVPLRELRSAPRDRVVVGLRHDVDDRLDSALELARLERRHGLRSTYFLLHSAAYYRRAALPEFLRLQELGHEVGWHNDLVTLQCVEGVDARTYLRGELDWLRGAGVDVVGTAAHGSYWGHRLGYSNNAFFSDFEGQVGRVGDCELAKGTLAEFGLAYDANLLGEDHYFSDARFDAGGRRWHPDYLDLESFRPGETVILLVHPCHWDASIAAKAARTYARGGRRLVSAPRREPAAPPASPS